MVYFVIANSVPGRYSSDRRRADYATAEWRQLKCASLQSVTKIHHIPLTERAQKRNHYHNRVSTLRLALAAAGCKTPYHWP